MANAQAGTSTAQRRKSRNLGGARSSPPGASSGEGDEDLPQFENEGSDCGGGAAGWEPADDKTGGLRRNGCSAEAAWRITQMFQLACLLGTLRMVAPLWGAEDPAPEWTMPQPTPATRRAVYDDVRALADDLGIAYP